MGGLKSLIEVMLKRSGVTVAVPEGILNVLDVLGLVRGKEHIGFKDEIRPSSAGWSAASIRCAKEGVVEVKTG